jgi:guanosine-3',5'-bis(diphosphate) 3'-pyrophosphohydrolase
MSTLERAIEIAVAAHKGQTDKGGQPYILHPLRVMVAVEGELAQTVAVLHDVVEDSDWTIEKLKDEGFTGNITEALDLMTKDPNLNYQDYIKSVRNNPIARAVKIADITDNMNLDRIPNPGPTDYARRDKYERALNTLNWRGA